ncbi:Uncharacterized protein QTN25_009468 [Entamoeba marina]
MVEKIQTTLVILYLILFMTFFILYTSDSRSKSSQNLPSTSYYPLAPSPNLDISSIDYNKLNYQNQCGTIFNQRAHSSRDLIIYSFGDLSKQYEKYENLPKILTEIDFSLKLMRRSLPDVTAIVLTIGTVPKDFIDIMNLYRVDIVTSLQFDDKWLASNAKVLFTYGYLQSHQNMYDRVLYADIRDVFIFADVFKTVGDNNIYWLLEHFGKRSYRLDYGNHLDWMKYYFNEAEADYIARNKPITINTGVGIGDIKSMIDFFEIVSDQFDDHFKHGWGYDLSLINMLYYKGFFSHLPVNLEKCTQRMCYIGELYKFEKENYY